MGDDLMGPHSSNPWGHFEDMSAVKLNETVLTRSGGSWRKPPVEIVTKPDDAIVRYIEWRADRDMWGFKDPRLCLTWPAWLPALRATGADIHVVSAWRDPVESAKSLERRDAIPRSKGVELAQAYHAGLVRLLEEVSRSPR